MKISKIACVILAFILATTVLNMDFASAVDSGISSPMADETSPPPTIYTIALSDSTGESWCYINETFTLKVYVKNAQSLVSVNIPILYDLLDSTAHVELLDKHNNPITDLTKPEDVLDINDAFELFINANYPVFDTTNRFSKIFLLAKDTASSPQSRLILNGENTWLCTLHFRAADAADYSTTFFDRFAVATDAPFCDTQSPLGAMITDRNDQNQHDTDILIFPTQQNTAFRIVREKSKAPQNVIVIPNIDGKTATVIVAGVEPGASVTIYDSQAGSPLGVPAIANEDGYVVFVNIPLAATTDNVIWADALETGKLISDQTSGIPDALIKTKLLVRLEDYNVITVANGTAKSGITMPKKLIGHVGYAVEGYDGYFILPETISLDANSAGFTCSDYIATTSATYYFTAMPDLTNTGLIAIQGLKPANQPVFVKPKDSTSPGGGGGGGGTPRPSPTPTPTPSPPPTPTPPPTPEGLLNDVDHYRYLLGYDDGTIRPERHIAREEVAAVFYRLFTKQSRQKYRTRTHPFTDLGQTRWSIEEIATMCGAKIVKGYPDGTFMPDSPITRAEFATITMRFDVFDQNAAHSFTDISGHWAEKHIAAAYRMGWVDGYEDGSFRPNQPITRVEAAKLINRVLKRRVDQAGMKKELTIQWPDLQMDHWGYYEIMEATISHQYVRRYEGHVMENWTGAGTDVDFKHE